MANRGRQYDRQWNQMSTAFLAQHPTCVCCMASFNLVIPAAHVDHIRPLRYWPELKYDPDNFQPLCISCHSRKSAWERKGMILDFIHGKRIDFRARKSRVDRQRERRAA